MNLSDDAFSWSFAKDDDKFCGKKYRLTDARDYPFSFRKKGSGGNMRIHMKQNYA